MAISDLKLSHIRDDEMFEVFLLKEQLDHIVSSVEPIIDLRPAIRHPELDEFVCVDCFYDEVGHPLEEPSCAPWSNKALYCLLCDAKLEYQMSAYAGGPMIAWLKHLVERGIALQASHWHDLRVAVEHLYVPDPDWVSVEYVVSCAPGLDPALFAN